MKLRTCGTTDVEIRDDAALGVEHEKRSEIIGTGGPVEDGGMADAGRDRVDAGLLQSIDRAAQREIVDGNGPGDVPLQRHGEVLGGLLGQAPRVLAQIEQHDATQGEHAECHRHAENGQPADHLAGCAVGTDSLDFG